MPTSSTYNGDNLSTCTVSSMDGSLSACSQQTLNGTDPAGGNTPSANPSGVSVYGGNLYIGTNAGVLILPIVNGTVTVDYPCPSSSTATSWTGTSCTIDYWPSQSPQIGFAFNNGYAYFSGYGNGGGISICTIEASGFAYPCTISPSPTGNYGGMAVH